MTKELKFDRARFDAGEMPTRTRGGDKVLWVADTKLPRTYPLIAIISDGGYPIQYTADGRYDHLAHNVEHDLVHEPRMKKVNVVLYRMVGGSNTYTTSLFDAAFLRKRGYQILGEHTFEIES